MNKVTIAANQISHVVIHPMCKSRYCKLQYEKGEVMGKKFVLFPYPHFIYKIAEEDLYFDSTDMYDNLYTEEQVRSDYILIDKVAYVHPYMEIYFVDGKNISYRYDNDELMYKEYNKLKEKFNLIEF